MGLSILLVQKAVTERRKTVPWRIVRLPTPKPS
jgi:hypothetical protein